MGYHKRPIQCILINSRDRTRNPWNTAANPSLPLDNGRSTTFVSLNKLVSGYTA